MKLGNKIENHSCNMWIMFHKFYKAYIKVMDRLMGKVDKCCQFYQQSYIIIRKNGRFGKTHISLMDGLMGNVDNNVVCQFHQELYIRIHSRMDGLVRLTYKVMDALFGKGW